MATGRKGRPNAGRPFGLNPFALNPFALRSAARTAVAAPVALAVGYHLLGDVLLSLFAWFAVFALLVFVDFDGPPRARGAAYVALALAGVPFVTLGTLCSRSSWAATFGMLTVALLVQMAGVINSYLAVATPALLLAFVLPVMTPGPIAEVPERLAGWGLGAGVALLATMLLWPARPPDEVRRALAGACRALADSVAAGETAAAGEDTGDAPGPAPPPEVMVAVARSAVAEVRRRFSATSYRPTGAGGRTAALGHVVVDVNWLLPFALPPAGEVARDCLAPQAREVRAAAVRSLLAVADRLDLADRRRASHRRGDVDLGIERLDRSGRAVVDGLLTALTALTATGANARALVAEQAFRLRQLAQGTRELAEHAVQATEERRSGRRAPWFRSWLGPRPRRRRRLRRRAAAVGDLAGGYLDWRAVWFRNSVRGAVGLALAVAVSRMAGLQHGFWVVLGTLSVLRSNAVATGSTVARALLGTALGIAVGGLTVAWIGSTKPLLWLLLPGAVLLAGYARKANAFAAGQAAFTISVLILFNIVEPVGWRVGLVRIEDVVIGFVISLVVGLLLWPRGAAPRLVRERAAVAYLRATEFLALVVAPAPAAGPGRPSGPAETAAAGRAAVRAGRLLDDAIRHYLAERPAGRLDLDALMIIVAGALRVRRTADLLRVAVAWPVGPEAVTAERPALPAELAGCRARLLDDLADIRRWYVGLAESLLAAAGPPRSPVPPGPPAAAAGPDGRGGARGCALDQVGAAVRAGDRAWTVAALDIVERAEHLAVLRELQPRLAAAARELAPEHARSGPRAP